MDRQLGTKRQLLQEMIKNLVDAVYTQGVLGKDIQITQCEIIPGPRSGALEISAGMGNGLLYQTLRKNDYALARQLVTWDYSSGDLMVYNVGRKVRIEAPWSESLSFHHLVFTQDTMIMHLPTGSNVFYAGINQWGRIVALTLNDDTPHYLISGSTGSGKSEASRSFAWQLSFSDDNLLVLLDAKSGEGLGPCQNLPHLMGPMVTQDNIQLMTEVLQFIENEMQVRYQKLANREIKDKKDLIKQGHKRIVIFLDEVQEVVSDKRFLKYFRRLLAQGRAANIHLVVSTQQPTADVFGDRTIKPNLRGRIALQTTHAEASRAALGVSDPRSDKIGGKGDSYCKTGSGIIQRVQLGIVDPKVWLDYNQVPPNWKLAAFDDILLTPNPVTVGFSIEEFANKLLEHPEELSALLISAQKKGGLDQFLELLGKEKPDIPMEELKALRKLMRAVNGKLKEQGFIITNRE